MLDSNVLTGIQHARQNIVRIWTEWLHLSRVKCRALPESRVNFILKFPCRCADPPFMEPQSTSDKYNCREAYIPYEVHYTRTTLLRVGITAGGAATEKPWFRDSGC